MINNYDHSEVIDPLTVKFYFKKPSPGFFTGHRHHRLWSGIAQHPGA
ncbi:hypothetical protein OJE16_00095 [Pantoea tagorei]